MDRPEPAVELPLPAPPRDRDQIVVLGGVPWAQYDALGRARRDSAGPRMAYLDGDLEITSPSRRHGLEKTLIARLVEAFAEETGLSLNGLGSETFRRKAKQAGVEPDECYCVGAPGKLPDFAVEIAFTSGGIDKLEVYRRLRVPEVWFRVKDRFHGFRLVGRGYQRRERSEALPRLELDAVAAMVTATGQAHQTEAVRAYRRTLRRRR